MDVSASFQFLVDELRREWHVIAPDWRGYGETQWSGTDCYWFPDYFADLDRLLAHFQPDDPVNLVGHSMGGNVAAAYAGILPGRASRLVCLEGFGMRRTVAEDAPGRYARWLREMKQGTRFRDYDSFEDLARKLRDNNARLTPERALFLARHWGAQGPSGGVALLGDPAHKLVNPVLYRLDEMQACWRNVTAPTLWIQGGDSEFQTMAKMSDEDYAERRACFRDITERVVEDAGHMMHHDQPGRLAQLLEDFIP